MTWKRPLPLNTKLPAIDKKYDAKIASLYALLGGYLWLHALADAIALFYLLEWTWDNPARNIGLTTIIFLLVSSSFGAFIIHAPGEKWKHLAASLSVAASCFYTGSIFLAYAFGKAAVISLVGGFVLAVVGVTLWARRVSFQINVQSVITKGALLAASLSSYALSFLGAASAIAAFQGKQTGWFFILVLLFFAFGLLTWRLAAKAFGKNAAGPAHHNMAH